MWFLSLKTYYLYDDIQYGLEKLTEFQWEWGEERFTIDLKGLIQQLSDQKVKNYLTQYIFGSDKSDRSIDEVTVLL